MSHLKSWRAKEDVLELMMGNSGVGEQTALVGAQVVYEVLSSMVKRGLRDMGEAPEVAGRDGLGGKAGEVGKGRKDEL